MISIDITNLFHQVIIAILIIIILYLGWKIKSLYKNFLLYLLKRRGRKGEKNALKLLKKDGYKILSSQKTIQGYLYENDIKISYEVRPDYLIEKNEK